MNDPNKKLDANLSSLLSLKAELLRKQEEVGRERKSATSEPYTIAKLTKKAKSSNKKRKVVFEEDRIGNKALKSQATDEFSEQLAKSKQILEAKSKFYDKMCTAGGMLNSDSSCLVRFNDKLQKNRRISESDSDNSQDARSDDDGGKWVEFTDCLGRTRRCLREDLDFFKKSDAELAKSTENENTSAPPLVVSNDANAADASSKIYEQRHQWVQKEKDNNDRDEIHYQDVFFDEARTHGVGYYAFSADKSERQKQQSALDIEREKTLSAQHRRELTKTNRQKIVFDRMFQAKNRQRTRLGLPLLTMEEFKSMQSEAINPLEINEPNADVPKKSNTINEEELKSLEEKRRQHLRPWDIGKNERDFEKAADANKTEDIQWTYKSEKLPMSQHEWNESKRIERNPQFAPPSVSNANILQSVKKYSTSRNMGNAADLAGDSHQTKPYKERNKNSIISNNMDSAAATKTTTSRQSTPYESPKSYNNDLTDSIAAGLQYLREQSDKNKPGTKSAWITKTTYGDS